MSEDSPPLLHIFGQADNHCEAFVLGNRAGLEILRDQIDRALRVGIGRATEFVTDGEGYEVMIICEDTHWQGDVWQAQRLPYTTGLFAEADSPGPWDLPQSAALYQEIRDEIAAEREAQS